MNMEEEEEAILEFVGNYSNNYYVQSPSSVSHHRASYSITTESDLLSHNNNPQLSLHVLTMPNNNYHHHSPPHEHDDNQNYPPTKPLLNQDTNMSRCSSSRASTNSLLFVHDPSYKTNNSSSVDRAHVNNIHVPVTTTNAVIATATATATTTVTALKRLGKVDDGDHHEDEEWYNYDGGKSSCWQYFSFSTYPSSSVWIALQLLWRFLLSVMLALLVFYIITKPPPPHVSLQVTRVKQFEITEGVDLTGVATTYLSCNISMALMIDNKSKIFGLHVLPPFMNVYFGRVPFVLSQGPRLYVKSREWREIEVYLGTNKKAMYGGGRNMEDMLNSGFGLPLPITLDFSSYFRVLGDTIHSNFHHHAHCLLILQNSYDKKYHTPTFNSTCLVTS